LALLRFPLYLLMLLLFHCMTKVSLDQLFLACAAWLLLACAPSHSLLHLSRHVAETSGSSAASGKGTMFANAFATKLSPL
jgi:hypothetical protein